MDLFQILYLSKKGSDSIIQNAKRSIEPYILRMGLESDSGEKWKVAQGYQDPELISYILESVSPRL